MSDDGWLIEHTPDQIEDADFKATAVPQNMLVLPERSSRGDAIEHMSRSIPTNEYGLPLFYIRSDLLDLPSICHQGYIIQEDADAAAELLSYQDGYPTFKSGSPFWTQMPHEPHSTYILFQRYLDLAELEGIRLIDTLARREGIPLDQIRQYFLEFFWSSRARSYDLFIVAAEAKKREVRTRKAENTHFEEAVALFDKINARLTEDKLDELSGKELLDAIEQMVKIQRLSLGLTGQNASTTNKELHQPASSVEVIFRQLTKNAGRQQEGAETLQNRLALLMADEDTAMQVQELIVRATGAGAPPGQ
jgi:hypothetical protein